MDRKGSRGKGGRRSNQPEGAAAGEPREDRRREEFRGDKAGGRQGTGELEADSRPAAEGGASGDGEEPFGFGLYEDAGAGADGKRREVPSTQAALPERSQAVPVKTDALTGEAGSPEALRETAPEPASEPAHAAALESGLGRGAESTAESPGPKAGAGRRARGEGRRARTSPERPVHRRRRGRKGGQDRPAAKGESTASTEAETATGSATEAEAATRQGASRGVDDEADVVEVPSWVEPVEQPDVAAGKPARNGLLAAGAGLDPEGVAAAREDDDDGTKLKRILVNALDAEDVRIAVLEDGQLEELYYERPGEKKYLGNIYKGRVVNLEPAIQAAFVDVGIGRNGFLHVSDVLPAYRGGGGIPIDELSTRPSERKRLLIQDILSKGQEVLVQISKDAIGSKGPSLTTYVSVPGKFLVLMPGVNRHGISKRIQDYEQRSQLRESLSRLNLPPGLGYILRTAGQDRPRADLEKDLQYLMGVWREIRDRVKRLSVPSLVYEETDLVTRILRDLFQPDVKEILVDAPEVCRQAQQFLQEVMPEASGRLKQYSRSAPIFSRFGVEEQIEKIYNRRVPLPSGGYLVVEQTEALVAIDVNSGKYRTEDDLEATALKINLEAAQEIARQLRLRDLGGVIINDFIDMEVEANRRAVERELRVALKRDRAKSWISRISRFGIVEMTRQRVRPSFERSNHEPCKYCHGTGVVKSARNLGLAILRQLRSAMATKKRSVCEVLAHSSVVDYLLNERRDYLVELERSAEKKIFVKLDSTLSPEQYVIRYH